MRKQLKICTFNVRNDNLVKDLNDDLIKDCYSTLLSQYKIDILATQEMIESTLVVLKKEFPSYRFLGRGRYGTGKIQSKMKPLKKYNEHATIITNLPVLQEKTNSLPWIPMNMKDIYHGLFKYHSITPRVLTDVVVELDTSQRIRILNTHLDCHMNTVRKRQLNYILNYIKESNLPVILVGDFNSNLKNKLFLKFIKDLDSLGLKRVKYDHKTFRKSKQDTPIDHIFIPKDFEMKKCEIIENDSLKKYSDHYPLYVTIDTNVK